MAPAGHSYVQRSPPAEPHSHPYSCAYAALVPRPCNHAHVLPFQLPPSLLPRLRRLLAERTYRRATTSLAALGQGAVALSSQDLAPEEALPPLKRAACRILMTASKQVRAHACLCVFGKLQEQWGCLEIGEVGAGERGHG